MNMDNLPDFSGKTVSFAIRGSETSQPIHSPMFEMQGNRLFVVGIVPKGGSTYDWAEGVTGAIAWEDVTDYLVFDSPDQYRKRLTKYDVEEERDQ